MKQETSMNIREIQFETDIETSLLTHGGWTPAPTTYQKELGLDLETLLTFLESTQTSRDATLPNGLWGELSTTIDQTIKR